MSLTILLINCNLLPLHPLIVTLMYSSLLSLSQPFQFPSPSFSSCFSFLSTFDRTPTSPATTPSSSLPRPAPSNRQSNPSSSSQACLALLLTTASMSRRNHRRHRQGVTNHSSHPIDVRSRSTCKFPFHLPTSYVLSPCLSTDSLHPVNMQAVHAIHDYVDRCSGPRCRI